MALSTGNRLDIYQDRGQWRPWPLTEHCTGCGKDEAMYTGNCSCCNHHKLLCATFQSTAWGMWQLQPSTICDPNINKWITTSFRFPPHIWVWLSVAAGKDNKDTLFSTLSSSWGIPELSRVFWVFSWQNWNTSIGVLSFPFLNFISLLYRDST